ncbi:hypothetical protein CHUAL_013842 [Chamberlinius hualienensis]
MAIAFSVKSFLSKYSSSSSNIFRQISTSFTLQDERESWFSKLLHVRRIEPQKESHSRMLSDKDIIYALHTDNVKPDCLENYLKNYEQFVKLSNSRKDLEAELIASWTVDVGDQDQTVHLWRYMEGYGAVGRTNETIKNTKDYSSLVKERVKYLRSRHCQYLLSFSFWNVPKLRPPMHIYEVRSYILKPGTMIEWGNNWARAIHYRQNNNEAFCGLFSQIGRLYNVHHFWVYNDLASRKATRESAWQKPGWDECVAYTVPLIKEMESRILIPNSFSPSQ